MRKQLKRIKSLITRIDTILLGFFIKNHFLANLYYFVKPSFWRENRAVLYGRYQYYVNSKDSKQNFFFLRRNIHRIEKGILMRPRREVFAESYIEETVDSYISFKKEGVTSTSINWAHDVLKNYFEVVNADKSLKIKRSNEKFLKSLNEENELEEIKLIPYKRKNSQIPSINLEELKQLAIYRRSVRWFLEEKVDHSKIDQAISIASYSPSACNRLPYKFMVFDNKEMVIDIANSAMGTAGYLDNIPTIAAVIGDLSAYPNERDRHLIYIDSSLAAMSFVYGLEVQGISSCIINWPDIEKRERKINKLLDLKPYERVIMLIAIGHPDPEGMVAYSHKKDLDEMRSYN